MDTPVLKKKLGLKERYAAMTRGLAWDTTYQPMDKVFPYDKYEGIKIHDWDKWEATGNTRAKKKKNSTR